MTLMQSLKKPTENLKRGVCRLAVAVSILVLEFKINGPLYTQLPYFSRFLF